MALYKGTTKLAGIGVSNGIITSATAPVSPVEGMVWYDTTNDVLKSYDGTNWNETGKNYTAGANISISANNEISATNTTYTAGTGISIDNTTINANDVVLNMPSVSADEREIYAALAAGKGVTFKSGNNYYKVWKFIDNTSSVINPYFTVYASNGNDLLSDNTTGYTITGNIGDGITSVTQYSKGYFTTGNGGVKVFTYDAPVGTYWNISNALTWQTNGGQVIFRRTVQLSTISGQIDYDFLYYVSYRDKSNRTIYLISGTDSIGAQVSQHVVTYDASGNVTNVTTTPLGGGIQEAPNSPITGIKYVWRGSEAQYAALSQYYTDVPGDTEFRTYY